MLKVTTSPTFIAPIKIGAYDENGKYVEYEVKIKFVRKDRIETKVFVDEMQAATDEFLKSNPNPQAVLDHDLDDLEKFVLGWSDIDVGGSSDFNRENLRKVLLAYPNFGRAVWQGYGLASAGVKLGN